MSTSQSSHQKQARPSCLDLSRRCESDTTFQRRYSANCHSNRLSTGCLTSQESGEPTDNLQNGHESHVSQPAVENLQSSSEILSLVISAYNPIWPQYIARTIQSLFSGDRVLASITSRRRPKPDTNQRSAFSIRRAPDRPRSMSGNAGGGSVGPRGHLLSVSLLGPGWSAGQVDRMVMTVGSKQTQSPSVFLHLTATCQRLVFVLSIG